MKGRRLAVLGAGILGSCLALELARRGAEVTLFDQEAAPVAAASRWNEGKLHLGHLYAADPGLGTARHVLPGSLVFLRLMQELLAQDLSGLVTEADDHFLIHRASVVSAEACAAHYARVDALVAGHPDRDAYPGFPARRPARALPPRRFSDHPDIVAAFQVPERSVQTPRIADLLAAAVLAEPRVTFRPGIRVTGLDLTGPRRSVLAGTIREEGFDLIINALWNGRLALDRAAGLPDPAAWSNRFRLAVFLQSARPVFLPSALIATGPFGDIKNYNGRDFYLSWYPAGLRADSPAPDPGLPDLAPQVRASVHEATFRHLADFLPGVAMLADAGAIRIEGGWVHAEATGRLDDPAATLHRRDRFGLRFAPGYISADTGKYATAPWLARQIVTRAEEIL